MQFLFFGGEEYRCAVSPCLWMIAKRLIRNRGYCQHNFKVFVVAKKTTKKIRKSLSLSQFTKGNLFLSLTLANLVSCTF